MIIHHLDYAEALFSAVVMGTVAVFGIISSYLELQLTMNISLRYINDECTYLIQVTTLHVCHLAFYQSLRESQYRCYLAGKNKTPSRFRIQFPVKNTFKNTWRTR